MKNPKKTAKERGKKTSRRDFLGKAGVAGAVFAIAPRYVLGGADQVPPSEKLTIACVGVGAQGTRVMMEYLRRPDVHIVAVCDVNEEGGGYGDWGLHTVEKATRKRRRRDNMAGREPARRCVEEHYAGQRRSGTYRGCAAYNDFREMLESEKGIDAVLVATPDHAHAVVSVAAMKMGKHVHCQKPMTHSVYEARRLAEVTRETGVATQVAVGNQASEATRLLCEWVRHGAIGPVREVHNWSNRPIWPQGLERPRERPPVPPGLDWDRWLGPAPERPYHPIYLPLVWRGWYDFGTGALGDMGCYSFDTIFRVLKLGAPATVEASSTKRFKETYPWASMVHYQFPARGAMPPVELTWYDGGLKPPRPDELESDRQWPEEGLLFVGDDGTIMCEFAGDSPRLIPESKMGAFERPPKTLPRSIGHDDEWIGACKGGPPAGANFEVTGPVTEALLLGNVALRTGAKLTWDAPNMRVTNADQANTLIRCPYRDGWAVDTAPSMTGS